MRPLLLDLFCGAGGAAMGYAHAGFDVVGVDIEPQPHYPFDFEKADVMEFMRDGVKHWYFPVDAIHASPPCQRYSRATPHRTRANHPDLVDPVRQLLLKTGLPYVIENVEFAPLPNAAKVCGSYFGLPIQRHRLFESNMGIMGAPCQHGSLPKDIPIFRHGVWYLSRFVNVYGTGGGKARDKWAESMGIDWMTPTELGQAIPPAYTQFIGEQLLEQLNRAAV
jgi:DNA (cytosine-5)-methyltransferase 1